MSSPEAQAHDTLPDQLTFEITADILEEILQPNEVLAIRSLDRSIQAAEADSQTDSEELALLRFQRALIDMSPTDAENAGRDFARQTGRYATFANTFGQRPPSLHFPLRRELLVPSLANVERWRIVGIDPAQYGGDAYANAYKEGVEESWREAREAKAALAKAQADEVKAMERASHPPVFKPRVTA